MTIATVLSLSTGKVNIFVKNAAKYTVAMQAVESLRGTFTFVSGVEPGVVAQVKEALVPVVKGLLYKGEEALRALGLIQVKVQAIAKANGLVALPVSGVVGLAVRLVGFRFVPRVKKESASRKGGISQGLKSAIKAGAATVTCVTVKVLSKKEVLLAKLERMVSKGKDTLRKKGALLKAFNGLNKAGIGAV